MNFSPVNTTIKYIPALTQACLSGRKSQTRRLIDMPKEVRDYPQWAEHGEVFKNTVCFSTENAPFHVPEMNWKVVCKQGQPGDVMTLAEPWISHSCEDSAGVNYLYRTDFLDTPNGADMTVDGIKRMWMEASSIPHKAVRQFQLIEALSVQRLQHITEVDCLEEGIAFSGEADELLFHDVHSGEPMYSSAREAFAALMDKLYGTGFWDSDPWVWVIKFKPLESYPYG